MLARAVIPSAARNRSEPEIDVANLLAQRCSGSNLNGGLGAGAADLKLLVWTLTGHLRSGCTPVCAAYTEPLIGMEMVYVEGGTF
jgi:hypothetical protein